jgi:Zn-dependent protease
MHATVRLGRIAGVEIGINWTWLFVVALMGWSLADSVFPSTNPGLATGTYVAMAAVAVPLFFACLLAHELGHATRARREGMEIEGITLWLFGGVAQFRGRFPSAGAEFRVAVAGPLVSLALGVVILGVATLAPLPPAVDGTLYWLGSINLLLLVFNMLPALPLDGGRVLHSALWAREHDYAAATHKAAALGRGFGRLMIVGGVALAIFAGDLGGLWLALIGWFLIGAAEAEEQYVERHRTLGGLTVADVMARDPVTAPADLPLDRFMEDVFFRHRHTAYPVVDGGRAIGLISFRAVAVIPRMRWSHLRVRDRMLPLAKVAVFAPVDELDGAIGRLLAAPLSRGLVLDHGRLAGLLSGTDALRVLEARTGHSLPRAA